MRGRNEDRDNFLDECNEATNNDNGCKLNGRGFNEAIVRDRKRRNTLTVRNGKIDNIDGGPLVRSVLTLSAPEDVWSI